MHGRRAAGSARHRQFRSPLAASRPLRSPAARQVVGGRRPPSPLSDAAADLRTTPSTDVATPRRRANCRLTRPTGPWNPSALRPERPIVAPTFRPPLRPSLRAAPGAGRPGAGRPGPLRPGRQEFLARRRGARQLPAAGIAIAPRGGRRAPRRAADDPSSAKRGRSAHDLGGAEPRNGPPCGAPLETVGAGARIAAVHAAFFPGAPRHALSAGTAQHPERHMARAG